VTNGERRLFLSALTAGSENAHVRLRRGSLVRTAVFGWRTFPDLWLTGDHFLRKLSDFGRPTRLTQRTIPLGLSNE